MKRSSRRDCRDEAAPGNAVRDGMSEESRDERAGLSAVTLPGMNETRLLVPNFHVALLHFPIVLLLVGVAIELVCSFAWKTSTARAAGRWMLVFAVILGWPAVYSGAYAVRTVAGEDYAYSTWAEMRAGSPALSAEGTWLTLRNHIILNVTATAATTIVVAGWLMAGARVRQRMHGVGLFVLCLASGAVLVSAWHGGELVYWHDATHIRSSTGIDAPEIRRPSMAPTSILPPLDTHVTVAGYATGLAFLAWGVAARSRRALAAIDPATGSTLPGTTPASPDSPIVDPQRDRIFAAFQQNSIEVVAAAPSAALGWIAALAFVTAAAFGIWTIATEWETWSPGTLLQAIVDADANKGGISRRLAHLIAGLTIIVLAILVGIAGARSTRTRMLPMLVGFVLLAAMVIQAWLGVLLLLDSNSGPLTRLNS